MMPLSQAPIVELRKLVKRFQIPRRRLGDPQRVIHAVNRVDLSINHGETLALIGGERLRENNLGAVRDSTLPTNRRAHPVSWL